MPIIKDIKNALTGGADTQRFQYQCNVCRATFESTEPSVALVGCPECGANDVRARTTGSR